MTFFMLGRIMKIFISSFLQRRPMIFKESFLLGRIVRIFTSSNLQRRPKFDVYNISIDKNYSNVIYSSEREPSTNFIYVSNNIGFHVC